jgi:hypothetical protein
VVPRSVTIAAVESELVAMRAYAARRDWSVDWDPDSLIVVARGPHPSDQTPVRLRAAVAGYRAVPPAWTFESPADPDAKQPGNAPFPKSGSVPGVGSSIFHGNRLICAPFCRLAFQDHGGPHGDWGGSAAWLKVRGFARATNLAEMLAVILLHLRHSPGWN